MIMGIKLSDYINDENKKLTPEEVRQFLIDYGFDEEIKEVYRKAKFLDEVIKKVKTEFVSEDLADAIRILVNDYEYDKEDE